MPYLPRDTHCRSDSDLCLMRDVEGAAHKGISSMGASPVGVGEERCPHTSG